MAQVSDRNIIIALVILQIAVCLPFISSFPIALDEPFSIFWAQQDLGVMVDEINKGNNSPLHFILLNGWIKMFGISPASVRSLSLLFSILTVVLIFSFSRKFISPLFSFFAATLFIFSRFDHFHSMEARMYSLFLFLFIASLQLNYELIFEKKNRLILLVIVNAAMLYTHYLALFCIASQALIFLLNWNELNRKIVLSYFLALVLTGLIFLPGLLIFIERLSDQVGAPTWVPEPHITELYGNILRFCNGTLTAVIFALIMIGLMFYKYRGKLGGFFSELITSKARFVILSFFVPYVAIYIYSLLFSPMFIDRYLLFTTIPLFIIIAFILSKVTLPKIELISVFVFTFVMACGVRFIPDNNRAPDEVAAFVKSEVFEDSKILIAPPYYDLTFIYHYDQEMFKEMYKTNSQLESVQTIYSFDEVKDSSNYKEIILVDDNSEFAFPGNDIKRKLNTWGKLKNEKVFPGGTSVLIFSKP